MLQVGVPPTVDACSCAGQQSIATRCCNNDVRKQVYNLVSPNHPSRKNYYTRVAEQMKLDAPEFEIGGSKCKLVTSTKFIDHFGHEFKNL